MEEKNKKGILSILEIVKDVPIRFDIIIFFLSLVISNQT